MILRMAKVRILGPIDRHAAAVRALQDIGLVHLAEPDASDPRLGRLRLSPRQESERRHILRILEDVDAALAEIAPLDADARPPAEPPAAGRIPRWARTARRARRTLEALRIRSAALEEERALVLKYRAFFASSEAALRTESRWRNATAFHVILRSGRAEALDELRAALRALVGDAMLFRPQALPGGETALLIVIPTSASGRVERALAEGQIQEIPVPAGYGSRSLAEAIPRMLERLEAIPAERESLKARKRRVAMETGGELLAARAGLHDRLGEIDTVPLSRSSAHAFVVEGFVPERAVPMLERRLGETLGSAVAVVTESTEEWSAESAPVVLSNPRLFRPFETILRLLPLPRYGSIDPTPFVAVFFPMFFGLILGDVGYALMLALLSLVLHLKTSPGTTLRSVSEIAGACALFSLVFGVLYGELFGDLGRRLWGQRALLFDREEAVVPFLALTLALGVVHVVLGLGLGVVSSLRREPRRAAGRGVSLVMILLIVAGLLAAVDILPRRFFTPAVVAVICAFPILLVLEGIAAPTELLSQLGSILSYARIMALGTASVLLAVVANRMIGALGSVFVGVLFALLFHLVNFALGLFTPVIHALRLHYVEFFGKFYSPGGVPYRPFGHWGPSLAPRD